MTKKVLLLSLPIFLFSKTVSFQEALDLTIQNNKELKAKKFDIEKMEQGLKQAKGYNYGKLELSEQISRTNNAGYVFGMKLASREANFGDFGFGHFIDEMGGLMNPATAVKTKSDLLVYQPDDLNNPDARTNFETKLTYEAPLYTGGKLESAKAMSILQIQATKAKYQHDQKALGLEVLKAYNGAVTAKKFISMVKKAKVITTRFVKTAKGLYDNKLTRIIDVKQAKMAQLSINTKIQEATTKFKLAIAYLQFLTDDTSITDVKGFVLPTVDLSNLSVLQNNAIDQRDDYKWMKYNTNTMRKKIDFDNSTNYPTIGAHVEYGTNDDALTLSGDKDYYLAAVGLTYTLFDGDVNSIEQQKSKIDFAKTKQYFDYMQDGIKLDVKKNFLEFQTYNKSLKEKIKTQIMAEDILKETESIYKNNLKFRTNMMYLLMSLESMLTIQAEVIQSTYNKTLSAAKLKLAIGQSLKMEGK